MNQLKLWFLLSFGLVLSETGAPVSQKRESEPPPPTGYFVPIQTPYSQYSANCYNSENVDPPHFCSLPPPKTRNFHTVVEANPLLAALLLSSSLNLHPKIPGYNHREHLPLNPYLALLLSHYGKYAPVYGRGRGLYGYTAANNYHNNKPFGAYKVYEDNDG